MIEKDASVILFDGKRKYLLRVVDREIKRRGLGRINTKMFEGKSFGETIKLGNKEVKILKPSLSTMIEGIERRAQIITPKDACHIIFYCSIGGESTVIEAGSGSGALTIALAHSVSPNGRVISYDVRRDFLEVAKNNIYESGYEDIVDFREGDVREGMETKMADAIALDFADPWNAVESAYRALRDWGYLCCYCPTVNQIEKCVCRMENENFSHIKTIEVMERGMEIRENSSRPSNLTIGHTAYMCFGRKVI